MSSILTIQADTEKFRKRQYENSNYTQIKFPKKVKKIMNPTKPVSLKSSIKKLCGWDEQNWGTLSGLGSICLSHKTL